LWCYFRLVLVLYDAVVLPICKNVYRIAKRGLARYQ